MKIFKVRVKEIYTDHIQTEITEEYFSNVNIEPGMYINFYAQKVEYASVSIITDPWALVFLDGEKIGYSPIRIEGISKGEHTLTYKISETGYPRKIEKTISVAGSEDVRIVETFEKISNKE
jgi:hypothetical protein